MAQILDNRPPTDDEIHRAMPSSPGPELDRLHPSHDHDKETGSDLPSRFSPPTDQQSTLVDYQHDISPEFSFSQSSNLTTDSDLTLASSQNNSTRGSIEPRTTEPVGSNLSFINFVTRQTPSLSLNRLDEPEEKIAKAEREADQSETLDRSANLESENSISHHNDYELVDQESGDSPLDQKRSINHFNENQTGRKDPLVNANQPEKKGTSVDDNQTEEKDALANNDQMEVKDILEKPVENKPSNHLVFKALPPKQVVESLPENSSAMSEDWLDIVNPKFQFAIGLFAVPWSAIVISSRLINQLSILAFSHPILNPISGLFTSILAPALLYISLITLFITSADHLS